MQAFELLYERHRGPLYRYLLRLVNDAATANDLYQSSWERVILNRRRYRPSGPFRAWIYRIAHNQAMDHFRRAQPVSGRSPDDLEAGEPGPDAVVQDEELAARLSAAVGSLPAEQREALLLKLEAGLDLASIAEVTGVNPETAKSRLRYAVAKLRRLLRE